MFVQWSRVCVLAALVSFFTSSAMAQSAPEARSGGGFDFYVLTLSWSPAFCESGGGREYRAQCEPGLGKGFVTHGLWPQYEHGFPSECDGAATPSRMALEHVAGVYPDEGLARHEWRKHGRCSGKSPTDYFVDVRRATESVTIPALLERPRQAQSFAPLDIQRAFIAANPRLRPGMLAVTCRKGALQDVRICFSRDLREFRPCPEIARGACRAGEISVPAPL
ncbi:ribonuclease T2 [Methylosinus sp. PW1]|uniref:ribonuclease T2 family protein n=1 Tax=Methylosinus sp. PW1 TaxID=107636 RepID=UPI0009FFA5FA|nr:ribonuclease T2 [Methylosinus sp. PW1]